MSRAAMQLTLFVAVLAGCLLTVLVARRLRSDPSPDGGYATVGERELTWSDAKAAAARWTTTTNHREIGLLYIAFGTVAAIWGGIDAMMLRTHLLTPAADIWTEQTYNELFTMHGLTMLIFFVAPVFFGIGNYFLPLLIGADDMAFPRLNAVGFWMLPPALLLSRLGIIAEVTGKSLALVVPDAWLSILFALREPAIGWTMYAPLSTTTPDPQINFLLLGLHLSGIATTIAAINFVTTVVYERGEGVGWANLDIFSWNMLVTSGIALFAFPLLGTALLMLLFDRNFGTTFFAAEGGGAILWQHLFWFWGHPEVYIVFLPATGLMSLILPKFVGRKLFGFKFIVYSTIAIGVLSFGVWAHHMFTTGIDPRIRASFMATSIAIAVPSAIKIFNWITTIWNGNVKLAAPLILCVGGIGTFIYGGITGVFLAVIPIDIVYHDTYYVVGHFHLIIMGIIPLMMFAASYYWYPIITGRLYDRRLAIFQSLLLVVGVVFTFGTLMIIGFLELPRRYATYPGEFQTLQVVATVGSYVIGLSVLLWFYNMLWSYFRGERVETADPWDLKSTNQFTREWQWFEEKLERERGIPPSEPEEVRRSYVPAQEEAPPSLYGRIEPVARTVVNDAGVGAIGGFVGTVLMTAVLLVAVAIGAFDLEAFTDLAVLVGLPATVTFGYAVFLAGGMITWPLLFLALGEYLPGELSFVTGLWYSTVIASGFAIAFVTGQTGLELAAYLLFVLLAHWAYGLGLAGTVAYLGSRHPSPPEEQP
jgi:cytochrome c oxidase subunit I